MTHSGQVFVCQSEYTAEHISGADWVEQSRRVEAGKRLRMVRRPRKRSGELRNRLVASTKSRFSLKIRPSDVGNADYPALSVAGRQSDFDFADLDGGLELGTSATICAVCGPNAD